MPLFRLLGESHPTGRTKLWRPEIARTRTKTETVRGQGARRQPPEFRRSKVPEHPENDESTNTTKGGLRTRQTISPNGAEVSLTGLYMYDLYNHGL